MYISNKKILLLLSLFAFLLICSFLFVDIFHFKKTSKSKILEQASVEASNKEFFFKNFLKSQEHILKSINQSKIFNNYLKNKKLYEDETKELFLALVRSKNDIMQLRYINSNGLEKIRINRDFDTKQVYTTKNKFLQDKSKRDYFTNNKNKKLGTIWYSNIDLNIEQGKVEVPFKPTVRFILPIQKNNKYEGILIINYFLENILNQFLESSIFDAILINQKGDILNHYEKEKSWSKYKKEPFNIKSELGENTYKTLINKDYYFTNDFVSKKLFFDMSDSYYLIIKIKKSYLQAREKEKYSQYIVISLIIILISSIFLFIFYLEFYIKDTGIGISEKNIDNFTIESDGEVLLVEDNEINQLIVKKNLHNFKLKVDTASNGQEAVHMCNQKEYDLILMDLQMPIMDGFEASKRIREKNKKIPIVALSAAVMKKDKELTLSAGMNDHISKPVDLKELERVISKYLKTTKILKKTNAIVTKNAEDIDIDLNKISEFLSVEKEDLVRMFLKYYDSYKNINIELNSLDTDSKEFEMYIHKLKGVSGNLHIIDIYNMCSLIENTKKTKKTEEMIKQLSSKMQEVLKLIDTQIRPLGKPEKIIKVEKSELIQIIDSLIYDIDNFNFIKKNRVDTVSNYFEKEAESILLKELIDSFDQNDYKNIKKILIQLRKNIIN